MKRRLVCPWGLPGCEPATARADLICTATLPGRSLRRRSGSTTRRTVMMMVMAPAAAGHRQCSSSSGGSGSGSGGRPFYPRPLHPEAGQKPRGSYPCISRGGGCPGQRSSACAAAYTQLCHGRRGPAAARRRRTRRACKIRSEGSTRGEHAKQGQTSSRNQELLHGPQSSTPLC
eukprot:COSAG01_NODE_88_length_27337_cov_22.941699_35_plen_174_part_00